LPSPAQLRGVSWLLYKDDLRQWNHQPPANCFYQHFEKLSKTAELCKMQQPKSAPYLVTKFWSFEATSEI
jgi:hypothetical protein